MMMMSSNTVGNHDFNTAGITPFDAKKPQAKKEATLKLANAKPDSFERTPRDTAPEAPPTAEAQTQGGNSGLVGTILGGLGTIVGGVALYFALSKGDAAEVATKAAEAAKKEATELRAKVETLGKGLTLEEIEEKIQQGIEEGIHAIKTTSGKTLDDLEIDIDNVADGAKNYTDDLKKKVDKAVTAQETHNQQTGTVVDRLELELQNLRALVNPQVAGKDVSKEVLALFKPTQNPANYAETALAKAVEAFNDKTKETTGLRLMQEGLAMLDARPGSIQTLIDNFPPLAQDEYQDSYTLQFNRLRNTLREITDVFTGKTELKDSWLQNDDAQLFEKTKAVVDAASQAEDSPTNVKRAQTELVTLLQETFGRSRTEQFKADYPDAVMKFDPPTEDSTHAWVSQHFNHDTSFDEMAKVMITEAGQGLDGTQTNNTHRDPHSFATIVLHSLIEKLQATYPDNLEINKHGRLLIKKDEVVAKPLESLVETLDALRRAFRSIPPEQIEAGTAYSFVETSAENLAKMAVEEQLRAKFINARLKGKSSEGKAEMATVTEEMYGLLRTQLQALNKAKSTVVPEVVSTVLDLAGLAEGQSVLEKITRLDVFTISLFGTPFKGSIEGQVNSIFTDKSQQEIVKGVLMALLEARKGDDLAEREAVQQLSNPKEVITVFKEVIGNVLSNSEELSDETVQTEVSNEVSKVLAVIKEGLPAPIAE